MKDGSRKKRTQRQKLSEMLAQLHGRYRWVGTWPAIPVALRFGETVPRRNSVRQRYSVCELTPGAKAASMKLKWYADEIARARAKGRFHQAKRMFRRAIRTNKTFSRQLPDETAAVLNQEEPMQEAKHRRAQPLLVGKSVCSDGLLRSGPLDGQEIRMEDFYRDLSFRNEKTGEICCYKFVRSEAGRLVFEFQKSGQESRLVTTPEQQDADAIYDRLWRKTFPYGPPVKQSEAAVEVPADTPPEWVENIYEQIFKKILPLKRGMTIDSLDAAIFGYAYSAIRRELADRVKSVPGRNDRKVYEGLRKFHGPILALCRSRITEVLANWKLPEAADYLKGFGYGIERESREESWPPSATTETLQIYKALLLHWRHVAFLTHQKKTAKEISEYIAGQAIMSSGVTFAEYFESIKLKRHSEKGHPSFLRSTVKRAAAEPIPQQRQFLKFFEKICGRLGIPLPPRGRPPS